MRKGMEDAMNRRELRRQRRRRNQIIAYLVAGLILAAILFGCVFVIRSISGAAQGGNGGVQEEDGGAAGVEEPTGETASEQTVRSRRIFLRSRRILLKRAPYSRKPPGRKRWRHRSEVTWRP